MSLRTAAGDVVGWPYGVPNGRITSDAPSTTVSIGKGWILSGTWSVDDADAMTFHFTAHDGGQPHSEDGERPGSLIGRLAYQ
ncbi:hypothetical protein [Rathayibacter iranicus]|uniref:Uncharacterized protein n=2 Tax=Rathayibacter iranicus TaxID=59737 RepID=A0AAD1ENA8_9MICO|nr:hypothetical protein [Rathayibacter iranicus]AZZ56953.1 hypothetical protein C7V51_14485 [Rathayibacter iranicus]MWV29554.1 hypothetical protein [Rathayibacter iranicus NCPPB 2253 = VKM Ac-1602]PPI41877.1 hypothetical protein C5E09_13340 [Rathayibacter iranicus]PPI57617.1 hypothetical protein C5E08_14240 [Rathayibacter iranicus]PPI68597.1 hypothetical protein C5E01_13295 [Rathayibacter iranicus]